MNIFTILFFSTSGIDSIMARDQNGKFYPGMSLERRRSDWQINEYFLHSRWNLENNNFLKGSLETRNTDTSAKKQEQQVLVSGHMRYNFLELSAGHRYLAGVTSDYLLSGANYSSLDGLPHGRDTGSAWSLLHFDIYAGGFYYLENHTGAGIVLALDDLIQINYHPGSKTGSFLYKNYLNPLKIGLDLQKNSDTYEGNFFAKWNQVYDADYFYLEAVRKKSYDHYYEDQFSHFNDLQPTPDETEQNPKCDDQAIESTCRVVRKGKNGRFYMHGLYNARFAITMGGQDMARSAFRLGWANIYIPIRFFQGDLVLGGSKTAFRSYITSPKVELSQSQLVYEHSSDLLKQLIDYKEASENHHQEERFVEDQMAYSGYEFKSDNLLSGFGLGFPKYGSRRVHFYMSVQSSYWSFGCYASLLEAGNPYPHDFFWLESQGAGGASLRFYDRGRGAMLLFAKSRHFYVYLSVQNKGPKIQSWTKIQWQAEF